MIVDQIMLSSPQKLSDCVNNLPFWDVRVRVTVRHNGDGLDHCPSTLKTTPAIAAA